MQPPKLNNQIEKDNQAKGAAKWLDRNRECLVCEDQGNGVLQEGGHGQLTVFGILLRGQRKGGV